MFRQLCVLALAAGVSSGAACARPKGKRAARVVPPVTVIFANQSLEQAALYVVPRDGSAIRIATVQPGRTETITVRAAVVPLGGSTVEFLARLLARARVPRSGPVSLRPGDRISVTLPSSENLLTVLPAEEQEP